MTQIAETRRPTNLKPVSLLLARVVKALVAADRRYRDGAHMKALPPERLDDMGLPRRAGTDKADVPFQSPAW